MELLRKAPQKNTSHFGTVLLICLLLSGCSGMVQRGGEFLEGRAFAEMELALYRSGERRNRIELRELRLENGERVIDISSAQWPGLTLRGSSPDGRGGFELRQGRILSSHANGWNEFILDISGAASFIDPVFTYPISSGGILYIEGDIERLEISSGSIRLRSNRLSGEAALGPLRNRRERILALTDWMKYWLIENAGPEEGEGSRAFNNPKDFERFWRPILFPELVLRSRRPAEITLPEDLGELKNTGALLRDWEEALAWIFIEYSWENIISSFNEAALDRIR